jgi:hypothetical protein
MDNSIIIALLLLNPLFWVAIVYILIKIFRKGSYGGKSWEDKSYEHPKVEYPPQYGVESTTLSGVNVKSHAEKTIADYLDSKSIRYVYEPSTDYYLKPDFYLPDYDVYIEYWGLLEADDQWTRIKYNQNYDRKIEIYEENNLKLISLDQYDLRFLDGIFRKKFKEKTGLEVSR